VTNLSKNLIFNEYLISSKTIIIFVKKLSWIILITELIIFIQIRESVTTQNCIEPEVWINTKKCILNVSYLFKGENAKMHTWAGPKVWMVQMAKNAVFRP